MNEMNVNETNRPAFRQEEKAAPHISGMLILLLILFLFVAAIAQIVFSTSYLSYYSPALTVALCILSGVYLCVGTPILIFGLIVFILKGVL